MLTENIHDLGRVIPSEARGVNRTEQASVGRTIVDRMKQRHATRACALWHGDAHSHSPDHATREFAKAIPTGTEWDPE